MLEVLQQIAFPEPTLASEQEAMEREDLFAALVRRQSRFVFRIAYSILRNAHDSEDVVQETFLKIYRSRMWQRVQDERAFLARAAWRLAVDRLRKAPLEPSDFDLPCSRENPEQTAIAADWEAIVHRLIDALPERLRLPLALSAVDELKSTEIAALMGIPEGTVRRRLMRARQILKQKLCTMTHNWKR